MKNIFQHLFKPTYEGESVRTGTLWLGFFVYLLYSVVFFLHMHFREMNGTFEPIDSWFVATTFIVGLVMSIIICIVLIVILIITVFRSFIKWQSPIRTLDDIFS